MKSTNDDRVIPIRPAPENAPDAHLSLVNSQAEQALLGALLINNAAYEHVADIVTEADFGNAVHGRIYEAIRLSIERGHPANPVTLWQHFQNDEGLASIGGAGYLGALASSAVTVVNAPHYAGTVADLSRRREVLFTARGIIADAVDTASAGRTAVDVIDDAEAQFFEISEHAARSGVPEGLGDIADRTVAMTEAVFRDGSIVVDTGLVDVDRTLSGLTPGDLIVVGGRPSMGKSAWAGTVAVNVARTQPVVPRRIPRGMASGKVVLIFSLEMSKQQLSQRWLAGLAGIDTDRQRHGKIEPHEWQKLFDAKAELRRLPIFVDDQARLSVAQMRSRARRLKRRCGGLDLIIIDHLQHVRQGGKQENRRLEIGDITGTLKAVAKELDVPVIVLSQLSRALEQRDDKRPMLSDLRESGDIEQDADVVMFLYRDEYYLERLRPKRRANETSDGFAGREADWQSMMDEAHGIAEILIPKNRMSRVGMAKVAWLPERQRFENLAYR